MVSLLQVLAVWQLPLKQAHSIDIHGISASIGEFELIIVTNDGVPLQEVAFVQV